MKKTLLNKLIILSAGVILFGLCFYAALARYEDGRRRVEGVQQVAILPAEIETVALDALPEETEAPEQINLPRDAVDILVDGKSVLCVSNRNTAEALLTKYLAACAVADEGERFLSAAYESDIHFPPASGLAPYYDFDTAFALLYSEPTLIPVTLRTLKRTFSVGEAATAETGNSYLYKKSRRVTQLGSGAITMTDTELTYVGDALVHTGNPVTNIAAEARTTLIEKGAFSDKNDDKDAGKAGKNFSGKLSYPMRGSVKSYFGVRDGNMHTGIDIENKAGTPVSAPGEGLIRFAGERGDYGFTVDIDHGNGFTSRLTHLSEVTVELNQRVFSGDAIGKLAESGMEGEKCLLHYEFIIDGVPVNPLFYLK